MRTPNPSIYLSILDTHGIAVTSSKPGFRLGYAVTMSRAPHAELQQGLSASPATVETREHATLPKTLSCQNHEA